MLFQIKQLLKFKWGVLQREIQQSQHQNSAAEYNNLTSVWSEQVLIGGWSTCSCHFEFCNSSSVQLGASFFKPTIMILCLDFCFNFLPCGAVWVGVAGLSSEEGVESVWHCTIPWRRNQCMQHSELPPFGSVLREMFLMEFDWSHAGHFHLHQCSSTCRLKHFFQGKTYI